MTEREAERLQRRINRFADEEGWAIFASDRGLEIERVDEYDVFPGDDAAIAHVRKLAALGSALHKSALDVHHWGREQHRAGRKKR